MSGSIFGMEYSPSAYMKNAKITMTLSNTIINFKKSTSFLTLGVTRKCSLEGES